MVVDVDLLYKIKGPEGPARQRVEQAVKWLLSGEANGIGEKLFRDAYDVHQKPLIIEVVEGIPAYGSPVDHRVTIDPSYISKIKDASGNMCVLSVERHLAHELMHAGQGHCSEYTAVKQDAMVAAAREQAFSELSLQKQNLHDSILEQIENAEDYQSAINLAIRFSDEIDAEIQPKILELLADNDEYLEYINAIEVPAMEVENQVARLLGEPLRENYLDSLHEDQEAMRRNTINAMIGLFNLNDLPGAPNSAEGKKLWIDSIAQSNGRVLG